MRVVGAQISRTGKNWASQPHTTAVVVVQAGKCHHMIALFYVAGGTRCCKVIALGGLAAVCVCVCAWLACRNS